LSGIVRVIEVRVIPRASKNELILLEKNRFRAKLTAVPEDGKANEALKKMIAKMYHVRTSAVSIVKGIRSRDKTLRIEV